MKKISPTKITTALTLGLFSLANAASAFAAAPPPGAIQPLQPAGGGVLQTTTIQDLLTRVLIIIFSVAILLVLFFLILGAFNWITSGGDKEKIKGARGTIIHALIGLAILALAFVIVTVAGQILNVDFTSINIPALSD